MKKYFLVSGSLVIFLFSAFFAEASSCPQIIFYLARGNSGSGVTELQSFLSQDKEIYPEGLITGYFGVLTENAVKKWQTKYGIVSSGSPKTTGYGAVGPQTRQKIKEVCLAFLVPVPAPAPLPPLPAPIPAPPTPAASGVGAPTGSVGAPPSLDLKVNDTDGPVTISKNSSATISWILSSNDQWSYCTKLGAWLEEGSVKTASGSQSTGNLTYNQTYTLVCYIGNQSYQDSVTVNVAQAATAPAPPPPPAGETASTSTQAVIPPPKSSSDMSCSLDVSPLKAVIGKDAVEAKWILTSSPVGWPFYWHYIDNGVETGQFYGGKTIYPYNTDTVSYPLVPGKYRRYVEIVKDPLWVTTNDLNHPPATCITAAPVFEVTN